jgi:hypothetical protein
MNQYYLLLAFIFSFLNSFAQNTFPTSGDAGVGTLTPRSALDVASFIPNGALGTVLGRLPEGDGNGNGTFIGTQGFETQFTAYGGKSFSIIHNFYGYTNSSINFYRGGSMTGGFIAFNTDADIERLRIGTDGNVGIGTTNPLGYKLAVNGKIRAQEVKVELNGWPDYVFTKDYQLPTLQQTEKHIKEKGHLPGIPSAAEVKANGIDLGEMNAKLLQKIEELTLHLIKLDSKVENLTIENKSLRLEVRKIKR